jgi:biotin carboxylase
MLLGALASTALAEPVTACAETWRAPALVESVAAADAAIARMDEALAAMVVEGVPTTIPLQRRILADARFRSGVYDTSFLEGWI